MQSIGDLSLVMGSECKTVREWAEIYNVPMREVLFRLRRNWDIRDAVTEPVNGVPYRIVVEDRDAR